MQRAGQRDRRRQPPVGAFDGKGANRGDAGMVGRPGQCDGEIERNLHRAVAGRCVDVMAADPCVDRALRMQRRQAQIDVLDPPVAVVDAAVDHAQPVGEGRHAGVFAGRALRQPCLQGGQIEHRRIQFDAFDHQILAAAAQAGPRQRQQHSFRAQDRGLPARLAGDDVTHHQLRLAAQPRLGHAVGGDLQAQRFAGAIEYQWNQLFRLQQPGRGQRQQQQHHAECDQHPPPAFFRTRGGCSIGVRHHAGCVLRALMRPARPAAVRRRRLRRRIRAGLRSARRCLRSGSGCRIHGPARIQRRPWRYRRVWSPPAR